MKEMTRHQFLKTCGLGTCCCTAAAFVPASLSAQNVNPEAEWLKEQLEKAKVRYARLVNILEQSVPEPETKKIFDQLGRECAHLTSSTTWDKYKGNIDGFLNFIKGPEGWAEQAEYDRNTRTIRVVDKYGCTCPLVKKGVTSGAHCECTLGWQRETYSAILGKPVEAELETSILRGGQKCIFRMKVL